MTYSYANLNLTTVKNLETKEIRIFIPLFGVSLWNSAFDVKIADES